MSLEIITPPSQQHKQKGDQNDLVILTYGNGRYAATRMWFSGRTSRSIKHVFQMFGFGSWNPGVNISIYDIYIYGPRVPGPWIPGPLGMFL
jgi:hypothetical protein